jgi:hypothetical protein
MKLGSSVAGAILFQGIQGLNHELYKKGSDTKGEKRTTFN